MTQLIHTLEECWYLSPPWGQKILPLSVSLLEKVYLTTANSFGYCCGVEWLQGDWSYAIALNDEVVYTSASRLIGTGKLQPGIDKPVFDLGEKVVFRCNRDISKLRIVQGIHLIDDFWTYTVEWASPALTECDGKLCTSGDRRAWVTDTDLVRV
ncbi:DUF1392 domain-containing protein [Komarekiella sp. 'clone 1']|uniref:DUF1392 domain-containing protein n=1 Tax=Komarekiella delphini-convector SJRDD-AB1 TaxID=2593771 RepID=A0AA40T4U1_9NOST|nr:DUF1392 family protein [Komarekiella delphini-convector]MBD6620683.1 DUF1392 domain-containing protein [Komarekiella delphini-convector SJRDD-AB1]